MSFTEKDVKACFYDFASDYINETRNNCLKIEPILGAYDVCELIIKNIDRNMNKDIVDEKGYSD